MSEREQARQKINDAANACSKVQEARHLAYQHINAGVSTNGYGVYHERYEVRDSLQKAKAHIDAALATMAAVDWPTNTDYELAE